ncbi:kinase A anchor protein [Neohortaea acidophila]|uniref:Kinase A anchor protein n=1 Tax=Neohortaea acidophila TaxID=245834 RepID=A0A6A6PH99_9PEZI|nr:kinase A anchor protein [Neohortaea acidophila]KAF2479285.1 kinase A anchor protein [Neohortaea acidophila]
MPVRCQTQRALHAMARTSNPRRPPKPKKPPLTHFLCVPLVTPASRPQLEASLRTFGEAVCVSDARSNRSDGASEDVPHRTGLPTISPKAVRPVGSIHCTLGVMSLDDQQLSNASDYLRGSEVKDLLKTFGQQPATSHETPPKTGPIVVSLKGLQSMHAPQNTSILYAAPQDDTSRLYPLCLALQKLYKDQGFLVDDDRELKLHATVINTIYAKGGARRPGRNGPQGHGPNANAPLKMDATLLLERYQGYVWMENVVLDRVAICEMGAKKMLNDEGEEVGAEYTEVASVEMPR